MDLILVLFFVVFTVLVGNLVLVVWALVKWERVWRNIGLIPILGMAGHALHIAIYPEGHNFWPIEIVVYWSAGFLTLIVIASVRYGVQLPDGSQSTRVFWGWMPLLAMLLTGVLTLAAMVTNLI